MNVLVFAPYALLGPHFETHLEIIQDHLDRGDRVAMLACNSTLLACNINASRKVDYCWRCIARRVEGVSLLSRRIRVRSFCSLDKRDRERLASLKTRFADIDELKRYRVEGFDIGWAVLSNLISLTRDPYPDIEAHWQRIRDYVLSAFAVYRSVRNYLSRHHVDRAYVFNGRFAPQRAMLRACQSRKVDCFAHERGHDIHHYALYENTTPHDLAYVEARTRERWHQARGHPEREAIAARFFLDRSKGVAQSWPSFVGEQSEGLLPKGWDPHKHNVAVFSSSEDECEAIGDEWEHPLYDSQLAIMRRIVESLADDGDRIRLYLRIHPHLADVDNDYTRSLLQLRHRVLTVIPPDDPVSTYALLKNADVVLTFGSTVGIEAVFWGRPSVLVGQSFYRNLGGTYNPDTHDQLIDLVRSDLEPKDRRAALMYGYDNATFGIPFKHFRATNLTQGAFRHRVMRGASWMMYARRFRRIPGIRRIAGALTRAVARRRLLGRWRVGGR